MAVRIYGVTHSNVVTDMFVHAGGKVFLFGVDTHNVFGHELRNLIAEYLVERFGVDFAAYYSQGLTDRMMVRVYNNGDDRVAILGNSLHACPGRPMPSRTIQTATFGKKKALNGL